MRGKYRTIDDVLRSPWAERPAPAARQDAGTDRVLRSTKLEDTIYADLRGGDEALDRIEQAAGEKLRSFPALSRDVYQSFYSQSINQFSNLFKNFFPFFTIVN